MIISLLVFGLFAGGLLVVKPGLTKISRIKSDISSLKEKVSAYLFVLEGESKLSNYKKLFSGDKNWLVEQVNSMAQKSGVSIFSILPEEPVKVGELLERSSIRIDAESNYHQLGSFVSSLESLDPYIKILSVSIDAGSRGGEVQGTAGSWQGAGPTASNTKKGNIYGISLSIGLFTPAAGAL